MKYGLIGEHLGHSFSKEIHEQIADYTYEITEITKDKIDEFMKNPTFKAINVTIPYKETVIPYLSYISKQAQSIGAVNTIVNKDGKLYGYNTDFDGMHALIKKNNIDLKNKKVLILGAGGTSKTAYAVATFLGAKEIIKVSIEDKPNIISYEDALKYHTDADVIINTTPCGMYPKNEDCIIDLTVFTKLEGVIDAIYNPLRTNLVLNAKEDCIQAEGGLYMLVAQAVRAVEIFKDCTLDESIINKVFNNLVKTKENIVLIGMPSSGKTTIGQMIALKLNKKFIDTDELIKEKIKVEIKDYFEKFGEEAFRDIEEEVIKEVSKLNNCVISTGGGAILRKINIRALKQNGRIYFINRFLENLTATSDRPLSSNIDDLKKRYLERMPIYQSVADVVVDNNHSIDDAVKQILGDNK